MSLRSEHSQTRDDDQQGEYVEEEHTTEIFSPTCVYPLATRVGRLWGWMFDPDGMGKLLYLKL